MHSSSMKASALTKLLATPPKTVNPQSSADPRTITDSTTTTASNALPGGGAQCRRRSVKRRSSSCASRTVDSRAEEGSSSVMNQRKSVAFATGSSDYVDEQGSRPALSTPPMVNRAGGAQNNALLSGSSASPPETQMRSTTTNIPRLPPTPPSRVSSHQGVRESRGMSTIGHPHHQRRRDIDVLDDLRRVVLELIRYSDHFGPTPRVLLSTYNSVVSRHCELGAEESSSVEGASGGEPSATGESRTTTGSTEGKCGTGTIRSSRDGSRRCGGGPMVIPPNFFEQTLDESGVVADLRATQHREEDCRKTITALEQQVELLNFQLREKDLEASKAEQLQFAAETHEAELRNKIHALQAQISTFIHETTVQRHTISKLQQQLNQLHQADEQRLADRTADIRAELARQYEISRSMEEMSKSYERETASVTAERDALDSKLSDTLMELEDATDTVVHKDEELVASRETISDRERHIAALQLQMRRLQLFNGSLRVKQEIRKLAPAVSFFGDHVFSFRRDWRRGDSCSPAARTRLLALANVTKGNVRRLLQEKNVNGARDEMESAVLRADEILQADLPTQSSNTSGGFSILIPTICALKSPTTITATTTDVGNDLMSQPQQHDSSTSRQAAGPPSSAPNNPHHTVNLILPPPHLCLTHVQKSTTSSIGGRGDGGMFGCSTAATINVHHSSGGTGGGHHPKTHGNSNVPVLVKLQDQVHAAGTTTRETTHGDSDDAAQREQQLQQIVTMRIPQNSLSCGCKGLLNSDLRKISHGRLAQKTMPHPPTSTPGSLNQSNSEKESSTAVHPSPPAQDVSVSVPSGELQRQAAPKPSTAFLSSASGRSDVLWWEQAVGQYRHHGSQQWTASSGNGSGGSNIASGGFGYQDALILVLGAYSFYTQKVNLFFKEKIQFEHYFHLKRLEGEKSGAAAASKSKTGGKGSIVKKPKKPITAAMPAGAGGEVSEGTAAVGAPTPPTPVPSFSHCLKEYLAQVVGPSSSQHQPSDAMKAAKLQKVESELQQQQQSSNPDQSSSGSTEAHPQLPEPRALDPVVERKAVELALVLEHYIAQEVLSGSFVSPSAPDITIDASLSCPKEGTSAAPSVEFTRSGPATVASTIPTRTPLDFTDEGLVGSSSRALVAQTGTGMMSSLGGVKRSMRKKSVQGITRSGGSTPVAPGMVFPSSIGGRRSGGGEAVGQRTQPTPEEIMGFILGSDVHKGLQQISEAYHQAASSSNRGSSKRKQSSVSATSSSSDSHPSSKKNSSAFSSEMMVDQGGAVPGLVVIEASNKLASTSSIPQGAGRLLSSSSSKHLSSFPKNHPGRSDDAAQGLSTENGESDSSAVGEMSDRYEGQQELLLFKELLQHHRPAERLIWIASTSSSVQSETTDKDWWVTVMTEKIFPLLDTANFDCRELRSLQSENETLRLRLERMSSTMDEATKRTLTHARETLLVKLGQQQRALETACAVLERETMLSDSKTCGKISTNNSTMVGEKEEHRREQMVDPEMLDDVLFAMREVYGEAGRLYALCHNAAIARNRQQRHQVASRKTLSSRRKPKKTEPTGASSEVTKSDTEKKKKQGDQTMTTQEKDDNDKVDDDSIGFLGNDSGNDAIKVLLQSDPLADASQGSSANSGQIKAVDGLQVIDVPEPEGSSSDSDTEDFDGLNKASSSYPEGDDDDDFNDDAVIPVMTLHTILEDFFHPNPEASKGAFLGPSSVAVATGSSSSSSLPNGPGRATKESTHEETTTSSSIHSQYKLGSSSESLTTREVFPEIHRLSRDQQARIITPEEIEAEKERSNSKSKKKNRSRGASMLSKPRKDEGEAKSADVAAAAAARATYLHGNDDVTLLKYLISLDENRPMINYKALFTLNNYDTSPVNKNNKNLSSTSSSTTTGVPPPHNTSGGLYSVLQKEGAIDGEAYASSTHPSAYRLQRSAFHEALIECLARCARHHLHFKWSRRRTAASKNVPEEERKTWKGSKPATPVPASGPELQTKSSTVSVARSNSFRVTTFSTRAPLNTFHLKTLSKGRHLPLSHPEYALRSDTSMSHLVQGMVGCNTTNLVGSPSSSGGIQAGSQSGVTTGMSTSMRRKGSSSGGGGGVAPGSGLGSPLDAPASLGLGRRGSNLALAMSMSRAGGGAGGGGVMSPQQQSGGGGGAPTGSSMGLLSSLIDDDALLLSAISAWRNPIARGKVGGSTRSSGRGGTETVRMDVGLRRNVGNSIERRLDAAVIGKFFNASMEETVSPEVLFTDEDLVYQEQLLMQQQHGGGSGIGCGSSPHQGVNLLSNTGETGRTPEDSGMPVVSPQEALQQQQERERSALSALSRRFVLLPEYYDTPATGDWKARYGPLSNAMRVLVSVGGGGSNQQQQLRKSGRGGVGSQRGGVTFSPKRGGGGGGANDSGVSAGFHLSPDFIVRIGQLAGILE